MINLTMLLDKDGADCPRAEFLIRTKFDISEKKIYIYILLGNIRLLLLHKDTHITFFSFCIFFYH